LGAWPDDQRVRRGTKVVAVQVVESIDRLRVGEVRDMGDADERRAQSCGSLRPRCAPDDGLLDDGQASTRRGEEGGEGLTGHETRHHLGRGDNSPFGVVCGEAAGGVSDEVDQSVVGKAWSRSGWFNEATGADLFDACLNGQRPTKRQNGHRGQSNETLRPKRLRVLHAKDGIAMPSPVPEMGVARPRQFIGPRLDKVNDVSSRDVGPGDRGHADRVGGGHESERYVHFPNRVGPEF